MATRVETMQSGQAGAARYAGITSAYVAVMNVPPTNRSSVPDMADVLDEVGMEPVKTGESTPASVRTITFRVQGFGFRFGGLECRVQGVGFMVWGSGFWV